MFEQVIGEWPTHERFILTSCDDLYCEKYFPRFYETYSKHWQLPIHAHVIDPSDALLNKLNALDITYTYCKTDPDVLKRKYSYVTYCQAQRFILLGHNLRHGQSVIVADVDSYALRKPNDKQVERLCGGMSFTEWKGRLMATFCNFHHSRKMEALQASEQMELMIRDTDAIGVDQLVIKSIFKKLPYNALGSHWLRHRDVRTDSDLAKHNECLIYHEKGTRGKEKGIIVGWTDIK
jgi:hypothetical protein